MAIFGKITVQVLVNGQALPEYEDDDIKDESPNLVLKHIEATSGAPFGIKLSVAEPYNIDCDSLAFYIWLDGSFAESRLLIKDQFSNNNRFWEQTIDGVTKNGCNNAELKPFIFSEITRAEEASLQTKVESPSALKEIGTIAVKVFRCRILKASSTQEQGNSRFSISGVTQIDEKKLKGMTATHTYRLGEPRKSGMTTRHKTEYLDGKDKPIAIITFKYCSRKSLQDMLLISRTPTPPALEDRPVEDLSIEELRELARRQQARRKLEAQREEEIKTKRIKPDRGVKRERDEEFERLLASAQARKVEVARPFAPGEVVDLGDD